MQRLSRALAAESTFKLTLVQNGEAIARRPVAQGFKVCINDVAADKAKIDLVVADLRNVHGGEAAISVVADVSKAPEAKQRNGSHKPVLEITEEDITATFNVNFLGVFNCYKYAAEKMISQGPVPKGCLGYRILGTTSMVAFKPFPLLSIYASTNHTIRGLTPNFAAEWGKHDIRVNAFAPGVVGTQMCEALDQKLGEIEGRPKAESVKKYAAEWTAVGRLAVPDDVAQFVAGFLCTQSSNFVTGQTIVVDGGIIYT